MPQSSLHSPEINRRDVLAGLTAAVTCSFIPAGVLGKEAKPAANERLNIAGIGVGGKGGSDIHCVESENNIVALCDVDDKYAAGVFKRYPKAKTYRDFQKMLDERKEIDAVMVATPDHTHAVISLKAIGMGKHVYCQKPLAHSIQEVRAMTEAARKAGVVTQMGNQGHANDGIRRLCEMIWDGAIGKVHTVHVWTNRPGPNQSGKYGWPSNIGRPKETPPVPEHVDWDLWLGPAKERPYHPLYHPFGWRAFRDFGTGALGDMGCHILDAPFWALKLGHPTSVEATSTAAQMPKEVNEETYPMAALVHYEFPARGDLPPVTMHWYDGGLEPPRPPELEDGRPMGNKNHGGIILVGDGGTILSLYNGDDARLLPESRMRDYKMPEPTLPRIPGQYNGHRKQWADACKTGATPDTNFDYSGPLTEVVLLGCLATRMGTKLNWDAQKMEITNVPEANRYVADTYREGWKLPKG